MVMKFGIRRWPKQISRWSHYGGNGIASSPPPRGFDEKPVPDDKPLHFYVENLLHNRPIVLHNYSLKVHLCVYWGMYKNRIENDRIFFEIPTHFSYKWGYAAQHEAKYMWHLFFLEFLVCKIEREFFKKNLSSFIIFSYIPWYILFVWVLR